MPRFGAPMPGYSSGDLSSPILRSTSMGILRRESWQTPPGSLYGSGVRLSSLSEKFSLSPDPRNWGSELSRDIVEPDDAIHDPRLDVQKQGQLGFSSRGFLNLGCLVLLCSTLISLFIIYPIITYHNSWRSSKGFIAGGVNATGQVPSIGNFGLIDWDTPKEAYSRKSLQGGSDMVLVFSDEFNVDGRSFYPGDDPYWEAEDYHYWSTHNLEWYDPEAVTTEGGALVITYSQKVTHDLSYQGGLITSWNKFCFTGGYIETAVQLPGTDHVMGMWPAVWAMGNLGRAGYGASLEGMWPYSYDTCDVGTAPNQTINGLPQAATVDGDRLYNGVLSFLPGQKLSRCTCDGESHPGPKHPDGTYVGRSAPEIDVLEAQMGGTPLTGEVSQSAQFAPFDRAYTWNNATYGILADPSKSRFNNFKGNAYQEATSVITKTNQRCYELVENCYSVYGFEYKPGYDDAYISWVSDGKVSWTFNARGVGPNADVEISARPVSQEPMYVVINLGMSKSFGDVDFAHLTFPTRMRVDYVRVYQEERNINVGCNPKNFPTAAYIQRHIEAYTNANLTTWRDDYGQPFPKNRLLQSCN